MADVQGVHGHPHPPRPLRPGRSRPRGVRGVDRAAPGRRRRSSTTATTSPTTCSSGWAAMLRRSARPAEELEDAPERIDAGAPVRRLGRARRADRGRRPARRSRAGTSPRIWTPGPLTRPPLLLGGRQSAHALGRPRAAAHHAEHPFNPQTERRPARRLPRARWTSSPRTTRGEALPAHEYRFVGLRSACSRSAAHHEQRFVEVLAAIRAGYDTAWDIAPRMDWSRPWDQIDGFMRRSAVGEASRTCARSPGAACSKNHRANPALEDRRDLSVDRWTMPSASGWRRTPKGARRRGGAARGRRLARLYLVDVERHDGTVVPLVLRCEGGGSFSGTEISPAREAVVYRALDATPVPTPRVLRARARRRGDAHGAVARIRRAATVAHRRPDRDDAQLHRCPGGAARGSTSSRSRFPAFRGPAPRRTTLGSISSCGPASRPTAYPSSTR